MNIIVSTSVKFSAFTSVNVANLPDVVAPSVMGRVDDHASSFYITHILCKCGTAL
jgi:hypothetical protein